MLKRLGIVLGIPIVLFFYLYLCKYLGSLMWPDRTIGYHWFNGSLLPAPLPKITQSPKTINPIVITVTRAIAVGKTKTPKSKLPLNQ